MSSPASILPPSQLAMSSVLKYAVLTRNDHLSQLFQRSWTFFFMHRSYSFSAIMLDTICYPAMLLPVLYSRAPTL